MNHFLNSLMDNHVELFHTQYSNLSKDLYVDPLTGKLIHPGEFGSFREELVRKLLGLVLPSTFGIGQGFITSSEGDISRQCDIIIYNKQMTPDFCSLENQRFIPIESVYVVIEVKSSLSKTLLTDTVSHLIQLKSMRDKLFKNTLRFGSARKLTDQIGTFIVCDSYDASDDIMKENYENLVSKMSPTHSVNMIVNIKSGGLCYVDKKSMFWPFPVDAHPGGVIIDKLLPVEIYTNNGAKFNHIKMFMRYVNMICFKTQTYEPELTQYFSFNEIQFRTNN